MCDPVSIGLMTVTAISGVASANAAMESAYAGAEGSFLTAEEYMKQVKIIETQAVVEESQRRDEFQYFTSKNMAAAASSGASVDSESFQAIRKRNERIYNIDENVRSLNEANAKGQAASQSAQATRAGFAQIEGGKSAYNIGLLNTGIGMVSNMPVISINRPKFLDKKT